MSTVLSEEQLRLFEAARGYLFRGTKPSWTFDAPYRGPGITPTTIDPLVAALFAARCRSDGEAVVLMAAKDPLRPLLDGSNFFDDLELAVNLEMTPSEFQERATVVPFDLALFVLRELDLDPPERLADFGSLQQALADYPRMTADQIERFIRRVGELEQ